MSVRANGSGDHLALTAAFGITTGDYFYAGWAKKINNPAASGFGDIVTIAGDEAPSAQPYMAWYISDDGSLLWADDPFSAESTADSGTNVDTAWHYYVIQRSGTDVTVRMFADSTSTTPEDTVTLTGVGESLAGVGVDWFILGQAFAGEWFDGEFESWRFVAGATLTDAQARTESQSYDYVLGSGTVIGNWRLKDIDADDDGLNDSSAGSNHLTNTGCIAGASTPGQLGTSTTPTASESVAVSDTGSGTALVVAAEN